MLSQPPQIRWLMRLIACLLYYSAPLFLPPVKLPWIRATVNLYPSLCQSSTQLCSDVSDNFDSFSSSSQYSSSPILKQSILLMNLLAVYFSCYPVRSSQIHWFWQIWHNAISSSCYPVQLRNFCSEVTSPASSCSTSGTIVPVVTSFPSCLPSSAWYCLPSSVVLLPAVA